MKPSDCVPNELFSFFRVLTDELPDVSTHSREVAGLCKILAQHLGYSEEQERLLMLSAMYHDVGKFFIPRQVLYKPGALTCSEFDVMREHVDLGYRYLSLHEGLYEAAEIVNQHHERFDGTGYPNRLHGNRILPLARALTIVDSFCAMTEQRSYNRPRTREEAVAEIRRCAGTHFDPEIAEVFCSMGAVLQTPREIWVEQVA